MAKKQKIDEAVQKETRLQAELARLYYELPYIPEPTYQFEVGDEVKIGHLQDVVVEEVLENGKIYKIDFTSIDNNYGNPITNKHDSLSTRLCLGTT